MQYILRLRAWVVRFWWWVNYAAESTNPTFLYTAPKLSHVDFSFSQSWPFHKALDIEQWAKFGQKKLALNKTNKSLSWVNIVCSAGTVMI